MQEQRNGRVLTGFIRDIWSSRLSIAGAAVALVAAVLIVAALVLDVGGGASAYRGLVAYALMPVVFVAGLLLIPLGVWLARRRARRRGGVLHPLRIDFGDPLHRRRLFLFLLLTVINGVILSLALYEGYHFTDSNTFCGRVCHTVMQPEYTAYQRSPHARVRCVECHIGSGASWYVKSKFSGLRQVWAVLRDSYHRPVPTPVENLRPARETCEACHWPSKFHGLKPLLERHPGATSADDTVTALLLRIGGLERRSGRYQGIHWHVAPENKVLYLAGDRERLQIGRIQVIDAQGKVREYRKESVPLTAGAAWRTLDCLDCHNRPSHRFERMDEALDNAILTGELPRLADIRAAAAAVLRPQPEPVQVSLRAGLDGFYRARSASPAPSPAELDRAAAALAGIYRRSIFPAMKIGFGTYRSHAGHREQPYGCFRCHDEEHRDRGGRAISQDCGLCHELLLQDEALDKVPAPWSNWLDDAPPASELH